MGVVKMSFFKFSMDVTLGHGYIVPRPRITLRQVIIEIDNGLFTNYAHTWTL